MGTERDSVVMKIKAVKRMRGHKQEVSLTELCPWCSYWLVSHKTSFCQDSGKMVKTIGKLTKTP